MTTHFAQFVAATVLRLLGPTVDEANAAAAAALAADDACEAPLLEQRYDCPERVRWALTAISDRESPGNYAGHLRWVSRHRVDSVHEPGLWRRGMGRGAKGYTRGALSWWCPAHSDPEGMSTVGPHGLIYTYNVHRLGVIGNCVPWWVFAAPRVSAVAARERYLRMCAPGREGRWCPSPRTVWSTWRRRCQRHELPRDACRQRSKT